MHYKISGKVYHEEFKDSFFAIIQADDEKVALAIFLNDYISVNVDDDEILEYMDEFNKSGTIEEIFELDRVYTVYGIKEFPKAMDTCPVCLGHGEVYEYIPY